MGDARTPRNEFEWQRLSESAKAAALANFKDIWMGFPPSATGVSGISFAPLIVESPAPIHTAEPGFSRQQMREDEENALREAHRIRNQGL